MSSPNKRNYVMLTEEQNRDLQEKVISLRAKGVRREDISKTLGISVYRLRLIFIQLGIEYSGAPNGPWTPEEDEILSEYNEFSLTAVRKKLKRAGFVRSEAAIQSRFYRIGLHARPSGENLSLDDVARILGHCSKTVRKWITDGKLKAKKAYGVRAYDLERSKAEPSVWNITESAIGDFLVEYRLDWDMRKIPKASQTMVIGMINESKVNLQEIAHRDSRGEMVAESNRRRATRTVPKPVERHTDANQS